MEARKWEAGVRLFLELYHQEVGTVRITDKQSSPCFFNGHYYYPLGFERNEENGVAVLGVDWGAAPVPVFLDEWKMQVHEVCWQSGGLTPVVNTINWQPVLIKLYRKAPQFWGTRVPPLKPPPDKSPTRHKTCRFSKPGSYGEFNCWWLSWAALPTWLNNHVRNIPNPIADASTCEGCSAFDHYKAYEHQGKDKQ